MPALADRGTQNVDMSSYEPVEPPDSASTGGIPSTNLDPGLNSFLRCPLPQVWDSQTDTLRQYYQGHIVPQIRVLTPLPPQNQSGSVTNIINASSTGGSSGGGTSTTGLAIAQTSVKTTVIAANATYNGSFVLGKAFQLLATSASAPCRIRLYGTAAAQSADAYRGLDNPPPAGTVQNIICDVVLDTFPLIWTFQDRIGANGDSPATSTVYISVTNLDSTTEAITVSFSYVALVT